MESESSDKTLYHETKEASDIEKQKTDDHINNQNNQKEITQDEKIFLDKHTLGLFIFSSIVVLILGVVLTVLTILFNSDAKDRFWLDQGLKYIIISFIQFLASLLVIKHNVKVNYTRKMVHVAYFIVPQILDRVLLDFKEDIITEMWNIWIILLLLLILAEPIRSRVTIINMMYKSVDRPEDRPYTLFWLSTQTIVTLIVIIPFAYFFNRVDQVEWIFIPILINGLADGLAEPIGVRFGKHKYKTRSCFSSRLYTRSYEGSATVFIVSLIIAASFYASFSIKQYIYNLALLPICSTIAEAFAPHTWDSPFIFLITCGILVCGYYI